MNRIFGTLDPFMEFGDLMGRKVANTQFLLHLLRRDPYDEYHFFLAHERGCKDFIDQLERLVPAVSGRVLALPRETLPEQLAQVRYHCFHLSDCITHQPQVARLRNLHAPELFPVTGVTHSLSYHHYPAAFLAHLWPGTTGRDCIVSTSHTGVGVVENHFSALRQGYGLDPATHPAPAVQRIPLAVDPDALTPATASAKSEARSRLGIEPEKTALLVFGRISHYSKMDLLPLLRALKRLTDSGVDPDSFVLLLGGWVDEGEAYHEAVTGLGSSLGIDVRVFERPGERAKADLYSGSDIFISVADNPQETFGITVLEAASAGLPVVASEYDGYRDLVEHGRTGFLVPTLSMGNTEDLDALAPVRFDSDTHLHLAQRTMVEVPVLSERLGELLASAGLRAELGTRGRERVVRDYSWPGVIEQWVALWDELWQCPAERHTGAHPLEPRYGHLFGHYTTVLLDHNLLVVASDLGNRVHRGVELPVIYPQISRVVDEQALKKLLFAARKALPFSELAGRMAAMDPEGGWSEERVGVLTLWALKHDLLERAS